MLSSFTLGHFDLAGEKKARYLLLLKYVYISDVHLDPTAVRVFSLKLIQLWDTLLDPQGVQRSV